jgi:hypothetical protein
MTSSPRSRRDQTDEDDAETAYRPLIAPNGRKIVAPAARRHVCEVLRLADSMSVLDIADYATPVTGFTQPAEAVTE